MSEETTLEQLKTIRAHTLVLSDPGTRRPIREILEILAQACPHRSFGSIQGGRVAPLTHPENVNPLVRQFLDAAPS